MREYAYYYTNDFNFVRVIFDYPNNGQVLVNGLNNYIMSLTSEQFKRLNWSFVDNNDWKTEEKIKMINKTYGSMNKDDHLIKNESRIKKETIEIQEEVQIGNVILEKGDKVKILKEIVSGDGLTPYRVLADYRIISGIKYRSKTPIKSVGSELSIPAGSPYYLREYFEHVDNSISFKISYHVDGNPDEEIVSWLTYDSKNIARKDGWKI